MKRITFSALVLAIGVAVTAHAGSTGTTSLLTPQGSGAAVTNGDYVSEAGSLDTFYRFFVEVPPGQTRMDVDVFDPDIGLGGAGEAAALRDRERTAYNSSATYTILNPAGAARNTVFATGSTTLPAGSDNAWTNFFSSTGDSVRDNFTTAAYTNNDGLMNWSTNWIETNDDNNPTTGQIVITGARLRIGDNGGAASTIEREANLTGFTTATLTFDFVTSGVDAGDVMRVEVSNNGGGSWTALESFTGPFAASSRSYNITSSIAANTRVRFISTLGYGNSDFFFVDNLQIKDSVVAPGHWEVRVDMSSAVTAGDDVNAIGIRAHDGDTTSGGTELNVYADSMVPLGINPPNTGTNARSYTLYPYITSGCSCAQNDFDYDSDSGDVGSALYSSRSNAFTQSFASATLSANQVWKRNTISGWTSDSQALEYGIWSVLATIKSYVNGAGQNGNYTTFWNSNYQAAANPPAANPIANSFRIYLPTDAGAAPVKPYLEQQLTQRFSGPLPVGQARRYTVTVRLVNPTAFPIVFSAARLVTANIPGAGVVYNGSAAVGQGSIVSQPPVGGNGDITWNPGTLAAGATAILAYDVNVTAASAGQRLPVTGTPGSSNGTRATWLDETGNATQARAIFTFGPLCELAATQGLLTDVLASSFDVSVRGGRTTVEWKTASEAGTIGFNLYRVSGTSLTRVNRSILAANAGAPAGGRYRFVDSGNVDPAPSYVLEELTAGGKVNRYGPYLANGVSSGDTMSAADFTKAPRSSAYRPAKSSGKSLKVAKPSAIAIGIPRTGIVSVSSTDIASNLGADVQSIEAKIRNGGLSLTSNGSQVAWTASSDGHSLLFFGESAASIYATERYYRLELGRGTNMAIVDAAPAAAQATTFTASHDSEVDAFPATVLPLDPEGDYWFWDYIISGDPTDGTKTFPVDASAMASSAGAVLQVRLQGAMADVAHRAHVSLNGVPVGDVSWSGIAAAASDLSVPAAVLHEGANSITVEGVTDGSGALDVFYVDGFTLRYVRGTSPSQGALEWSANAGAAVTTGPFAAAPMVLDVTERRAPIVMRTATAGSNASFVVSSSKVVARTLFASDSTGLVAPSSFRAIDAASLKDTKNRADYLVVAPAALRVSADALAALRSREGLETYVADLDQVYDEFNGSNPNPHAIHDFVAATRNWQRAPRYVVLAGTGTMDYRSLTTGPGLVPPIMIRTDDGLFAGDSQFTDLNGDGLPDVAIGRIPVSTSAELDAYVAKLDASARATQRASLVFSADAADRGADFERSSALAEAPLAARPESRIYLGVLGDSARPSFLNAWRAGAPLVSWVGHGGVDVISNTSLLTASDAPSLTTNGQLPLFVAMTCTINRFELGDVESLGAALTRAPNAGATAVWSASGLSVHADAEQVERSFMMRAARTPDARIGDLVVQSLADNVALRDTGRLYLLLGDPAIRLALPAENHATPGAPQTGRE
jgi:hypothetical protein